MAAPVPCCARSSADQCRRGRQCSKLNGHKGRCNSERSVYAFWETSPVYKLNVRKRSLVEEEERVGQELAAKAARLDTLETELKDANADMLREMHVSAIRVEELQKEKEASVKEASVVREELLNIQKQYDQVKSMLSVLGLDPKQFSKSRRASNSTSKDMIDDFNSSTRYRRRKETEKALQFIHGGATGSYYGAWDYLSANAPKELIDEVLSGYKRGKYLQETFGKAMKEFQSSPEAIKHAVAIKYQNFLSRRKFDLVCKTQSSYFNGENEIWVPRNVQCLGIEIRLPQAVSDKVVDKFVKDLNIGHCNQIPNAPGVTRTVTGLVCMIMDLHLRVPCLYKKLIWFNELENHFIFQFSDDGAPETSQLTMSIGSITLWNLGDRVRSRDYQYLLHCVSLGEKHQVLEDLWEQHTAEMALLEGNIISICNKQCTVEFQPSADMSWQSWASNEVNQAATHPSPYANVSKTNMTTMGGSIGFADGDTWQPYTNAVRKNHVKMVQQYTSSLSATLSKKAKHEKILQYLAENGLRQLGPPRIGIFAERQRPEPVHCEINAWKQLLHIIYIEYVQRGKFDVFIDILGAPVGKCTTSDTRPAAKEQTPAHDQDTGGESVGAGERIAALEIAEEANVKLVTHMANCNSRKTPEAGKSAAGCGLAYLVPFIKEHYADENKRYNQLPTRLIGDQAISLARYGFRLIDGLECDDESPAQHTRTLALGRIVLYLRQACTLFNKVSTNKAELLELKEYCQLYFNLFCLFFPNYVNVTTWTVAFAIPYHALMLFEQYGTGYGIISLQAKEAKHSGVKSDLALTNRSNKADETGKWWQVMRANYIRSFYLPEHHPMPSPYSSHFKSRVPPHCNLECYCSCGRKKEDNVDCCANCLESMEVVLCAQNKEFTSNVLGILKPAKCSTCGSRFPDKATLESHITLHTFPQIRAVNKAPKDMKVNELRNELRLRNLCTTGNKDILVRRLEGAVADEH
ncbi:uncharacterized protein LOC144646172 [Oculina patagonica]